MKLKFFIFFIIGFASTSSLNAENLGLNAKPLGFGDWRCGGISIAESFVPGLGYLINEDFDKAIVFGSLKWGALINYTQATQNENYQEDYNDTIEHKSSDESESGKEELNFYYNKSTYDASLYGTIYQNLMSLTIYDHYAHACQKNTDTYWRLSDPLNIPHYWDKWYFWLVFGMAMIPLDDDVNYNYYLGDGLTEEYMRSNALPQYYIVGIGEETFFRGVLQSFFQELYKGWSYSEKASWHLGVFTASAVFGMAHAGIGIQATALQAFVMGLYFGYVYQPNPNTYDIITASAIHSWWDIIITYKILNKAEFRESDSPIKNKKFTLLNLQHSF